MNRQQKENTVESLEQKFAQSQAAFFVNCQRMTVLQMEELRGILNGKNSELKVAKNRLVKLALKGMPGSETLSPMLKGQSAVVFAQKDFTAVAKVLFDFSKDNEVLEIFAGCGESQIFDKSAVAKLAKLPSREVLLAQLCCVMNAPVSSFVNVLRQHLIKALLTLKAIADQKAQNS